MRPPRASTSQSQLLLRMAIAAMIFWVAVQLIALCDWDRGGCRSLLLLVALAVAPYLVVRARRNAVMPSGVGTKVLVVAGIGLLAWHFLFFAQYLRTAPVIGIASTTLEAGDAMLAGKNPYRLPIDPHPEFAPSDIPYDGYKYLPLMPLTYLPLGAVWRERGLLVTNLLLDLAMAVLLYQLGTKIGNRETGLVAAVLYLMLPFVLYEVFVQGVTDLSAMVPLLAALLCVEKRPLGAGVLVGLSISSKLLPGLLFIVCCLPQNYRGRYLMGLVLGLIPVLGFAILSPVHLFSNIVLFVLRRPPDSTTWLHAMPAWVGWIALVAFALTIGGSAAYVWRWRPGLVERCGVAVICVLMALLSGSVCHRNYQLWWVPLFAVLIAAVVWRDQTARQTQPM
jgi:Glycosyltransferase family 87